MARSDVLIRSKPPVNDRIRVVKSGPKPSATNTRPGLTLNRKQVDWRAAMQSNEPENDLKLRFRSYTSEDASGCWIWQRYVGGRGYGQTHLDGRSIVAHRAAYLIFNGPIPDGHEIDHTCNVKRCVNPKHLRAATRSQNQQNLRIATTTKSGVKNVNWHKPSQSWMVRVKLHGKDHIYGYFTRLEDAVKRASAARKELHPYGKDNLK